MEMTDDNWVDLCDKVDETIQDAIDDLPEEVHKAAEEISCIIDRYSPDSSPNKWILGCYMKRTHGPIIIYVGQIYKYCNGNVEETMKCVRRTYYHELAHAIGNLVEYEVKERGL